MMDLPDLLGAAFGSVVPAALFRAFHGTGIELLALLLVAFGGSGGGSGTTLTVTGVSPLTLVNALAKRLVSLTQYGKCELRDPDVPSTYQRVEYIEADGAPYILTGVKLASTDVVECEFANSSATGYGGLYGVYKAGESSAFYSNQTYYAYNATNAKVDTGVAVDTAWHTLVHDFVAGALTLDGATTSFDPFSFANTDDNAVFARLYNNAYGYFFKGKVRKYRVTRDGAVISNLIPARTLDATPVYGLYDTVSKQFLGNSGEATITGGADVTVSPTSPWQIWCNNGQVFTGNAVSNTPDGQGTFVSPSDTTTTRVYKAFPPLEIGRSYTTTVTGTDNEIIVQRKNPNDPTDYGNVSGWVTSYDFVAEANYIYGIAIRKGSSTIRPSTFVGTLSLNATDGKPWAAGTPEVITLSADGADDQTITNIPNLLAAGGYADEVELVEGIKTRKVGLYVCTGADDEAWVKASGYQTVYYLNIPDAYYNPNASERIALLCTHYVGTDATNVNMPNDSIKLTAQSTALTVPLVYVKDGTETTLAGFKAKLAAEYAAGHPVIAVYPLATPTTEQTTPHSLTTTQGDNTLTATSPVDGIQFEVEYKGVAS